MTISDRVKVFYQLLLRRMTLFTSWGVTDMRIKEGLSRYF